MYVEQLYTGCLAEAAYYIESDGEVAIIDPMRETGPYIKMAEERGDKIKYVFETHFHADFVSGHIDLAKKTGADIVYGPTATTEFDAIIAEDNQIFEIGKIKIKVLHTPGHTMESSTYLLIDEDGKDYAIFSGDTLFIGDVGRPDLAVKSDLTKEDLAGKLYDSLCQKIMPLADDVIVYPGHGAGSACGKNLSTERFDTLGNQKKNNYALQCGSKEEFIQEVTDGILPPPQYFPKNAVLNKTGYQDFDNIMDKSVNGLNLDDFNKEISDGALLLDVRSKDDFRKGFIPNSIFIGLDGSFAPWVGALVEDLKKAIVIVVEEGQEEEAITRLARVGYDNVKGYLKGGVSAWKGDLNTLKSVTAEELASLNGSGDYKIVDVRKPTEFEAEHVEDAIGYSLDFINEHLNDLSKSETLYVHCKSGYRSVIATSILMKHGYTDLVDVKGGMQAIEKTNIALTAYVCPNS